MINRTKLSVIAVSAVLAVALTGCGGSASSAPSSVSSASASAPVSDAASPAADTAENGAADLDSAGPSQDEFSRVFRAVDPADPDDRQTGCLLDLGHHADSHWLNCLTGQAAKVIA